MAENTLKQFNVRLSVELHEQLRRESFKSGYSLNSLVNAAIETYLAALERRRERENGNPQS